MILRVATNQHTALKEGSFMKMTVESVGGYST